MSVPVDTGAHLYGNAVAGKVIPFELVTVQ